MRKILNFTNMLQKQNKVAKKYFSDIITEDNSGQKSFSKKNSIIFNLDYFRKSHFFL